VAVLGIGVKRATAYTVMRLMTANPAGTR